MTIFVKLFAIYQEIYGLPELKMDLPERTTVSEVLDQMIAQYPQLEQWRSLTRFGVNLQFVEGDTVLRDGDELVLIPPVSGG
jgi:molybdopterin synthase sulfur carrier subunit